MNWNISTHDSKCCKWTSSVSRNQQEAPKGSFLSTSQSKCDEKKVEKIENLCCFRLKTCGCWKGDIGDWPQKNPSAPGLGLPRNISRCPGAVRYKMIYNDIYISGIRYRRTQSFQSFQASAWQLSLQSFITSLVSKCRTSLDHRPVPLGFEIVFCRWSLALNKLEFELRVFHGHVLGWNTQKHLLCIYFEIVHGSMNCACLSPSHPFVDTILTAKIRSLVLLEITLLTLSENISEMMLSENVEYTVCPPNDHLTGDNDHEWSETIRIGVPDFPTSQMIRWSCPVGLLETWMLPHSRPWPKQFLPRQSENLKIWNSLIYKETYDIKGHKRQIVHMFHLFFIEFTSHSIGGHPQFRNSSSGRHTTQGQRIKIFKYLRSRWLHHVMSWWEHVTTAKRCHIFWEFV